MPGWTDAHNHLQDPRLGDPAPVIAAMRAAGITRCVVNATSENDWAAVATLALREPEFVTPAFGIHPWYAHLTTPGWQQRLAKLLETHPRASLGECGLDSRVATPSLAIQGPVLRAQLQLAREYQRPITLHCLKAWALLLESLAADPPPTRFLLHAFNGSIETARRLLPLGAVFSFSGHFLQPRHPAVLDVFRQLPTDRIVLESDAPNLRPPAAWVSHSLPLPLNHPANLPACGHALAAALAMPPAQLAQLTRANASFL